MEKKLVEYRPLIEKKLKALIDNKKYAQDGRFVRELCQSLQRFIIALPVLRTFHSSGRNGFSKIEIGMIESIFNEIQNSTEGKLSGPDRFLRALLLRKSKTKAGINFILFLQQLSVAVYAKGVIDCAVYRLNVFAAMNELGVDRSRFSIGLNFFHKEVIAMRASWPTSVNTLSTHDSEKSGDLRARMNVISEMAEEWSTMVLKWSKQNNTFWGGSKPDRSIEYLYYQVLVGSWPISEQRLQGYFYQVMCEAGVYTDWPAHNDQYEQAVASFISRTLKSKEFIKEIEQAVSAIKALGYLNSMSQNLLMLTVPGVPDIYQGNEIWNYALVDPDNRGTVDFGYRDRLLQEIKELSSEQVWSRLDDGAPKLWLHYKLLNLKRMRPELFNSRAKYNPVYAQGEKADCIISFMRGSKLLALAPRFHGRLRDGWGETTITLTDGNWHNYLSNENIAGGEIRISDLLKKFPVAVLIKEA